jgi:hypothetical protein
MRRGTQWNRWGGNRYWRRRVLKVISSGKLEQIMGRGGVAVEQAGLEQRGAQNCGRKGV